MSETFPLQKGSKGERVKMLQTGLNALSELRGSPDRLAVDGQFGDGTLKLLKRLLNKSQVTQDFWVKLQLAWPAAANRLAYMRQTGKSVDKALAEVMKNEIAIFEWLLRTYELYTKLSPERRKPLMPAFDAAFKLAVKQRKRFQQYDGAGRDIIIQKGWDPKYESLAKKYVAKPGVGLTNNQATAANIVLAYLAPVVPLVPAMVGFVIIGKVVVETVLDWLTVAYHENTKDFKKTAEIQAILDKLPKEDQVVLEAAIEKQLDQNYSEGRRDGKLGFSFGTLKWVAVGTGLFLLYNAYAKAPAMAAYKAYKQLR